MFNRKKKSYILSTKEEPLKFLMRGDELKALAKKNKKYILNLGDNDMIEVSIVKGSTAELSSEDSPAPKNTSNNCTFEIISMERLLTNNIAKLNSILASLEAYCTQPYLQDSGEYDSGYILRNPSYEDLHRMLIENTHALSAIRKTKDLTPKDKNEGLMWF